MPTEPLDYRRLVTEVSEALADLRQRLRPMLDRLMPEGYGVRSFSRSTGLELTSAWRCWTIAHVADPSQALRAMPGSRAWGSILGKIEERLGTSRELDGLRASVERLESLIRDRRLNRVMLRALAAGGLDSSRESAALLEARRASVRSAATLYGVSCKTRLCASIVAPGSKPGSVSIGYAGGFDRIARTRPGLPWPILRESVVVERRDPDVQRQKPLGDGDPLPSVIRSFSSRGIVGAELRPGRRHSWNTIDLADVPPDRSGHLRVFHAEVQLDAGTIPAGTIENYDHSDQILVPTELLVSDLLVHVEVGRHTEPASALYATLVGPESLTTLEESPRLPLELNTVRVPSIKLPARLAALDSGYRKAIDRVLKAVGATLDEFEVFRLALPHPPFGSMVVTSCELFGRAARG